MPSLARWAREAQGCFPAKQNWQTGPSHRVVEPLPEGGWDWVVWTAESHERCLYGTAETAEGAMQAAEDALTLLRRAPDLFLECSHFALHSVRPLPN